MKGKERGLFFFFCLLRWIISNVRVIHFIFDLPGCKKRNQEQEQTIKIIFVFFFFLKKINTGGIWATKIYYIPPVKKDEECRYYEFNFSQVRISSVLQ